jgi:hypothetical protein
MRSMPFRRLVVSSSAIRLQRQGGSLRIPLEGTVTDGADGRIHLAAVSELGDGRCVLAGWLDITQQIVRVAADLERVDPGLACPWLRPGGGRLSGLAEGTVALDPRDDAWRVEADISFAARLAADGRAPRAATEGGRLSGACRFEGGAVAELAGRLSCESVAFGDTVVRDAALAFERVGEALRFRIEGTNAAVRSGSARGEITGLFAGAQTDAEPGLSASIVVDNLVAAAGAFSGSAEAITVRAGGRRGEDRFGSTLLETHVTNAVLSGRGIRLGIPAAHAELGGALAGPRAVDGTFRIDEVAVDDHRLPGIHGTVAGAEDRLDCRAAWSAVAGDGIVLTAAVARAEAGGWRCEFAAPEFEVGPDSPLADWVRRRWGWTVSGTLSAEGHWMDKSAPRRPRIAVRAADMSVSRERMAVEGLEGTVTLDGVAPLGTAGGQRLSAKLLRFGDIRLADGELRFRLEGDDVVFVEQTTWRWCGGMLSSLASRYNPADGVMDSVLFAVGLDVAEILGLILAEKATGSGRLYGRLPLRVRWRPRPGISLRGGYLLAGSEGGTFKVLDRELLKDVMAAGLPGARRDEGLKAVRDQITVALRDFEYTRLGLTFVPGEGGRPAGTIQLAGRGRKGEELPLRLTINFTEQLLP